MPSRLERRYARMPDEKLRLRAKRLDSLTERERVTLLEELSARRLSLAPVVEERLLHQRAEIPADKSPKAAKKKTPLRGKHFARPDKIFYLNKDYTTTLVAVLFLLLPMVIYFNNLIVFIAYLLLFHFIPSLVKGNNTKLLVLNKQKIYYYAPTQQQQTRLNQPTGEKSTLFSVLPLDQLTAVEVSFHPKSVLMLHTQDGTKHYADFRGNEKQTRAACDYLNAKIKAR